VGPDPLQGPLLTIDLEGLHQRRTRAAFRSGRAQHQTAGLRPGDRAVPPDRHPACGHGRAVLHHPLDCVTTGFLPDGTLDALPLPSRIGRTRVGGIDLNKPRIRAALAAVLALAAAPSGFTVADLAAKVQQMTGLTQTGSTIRQAADDLRKLRGKDLIVKPGRSRRYQVRPQAARTIAGLLTLRDQVIGPILAGVRSPRLGRKPAHWTAVDRDYETLRIGMQTLFADLGIAAGSAAA
jgi:hypothetical protein